MAINWTILYKEYKELWIALEDDEQTVISSGKTAKEVYKKAVNKGFNNPIIANVPKEMATYIGIGN